MRRWKEQIRKEEDEGVTEGPDGLQMMMITAHQSTQHPFRRVRVRCVSR
jgi:hypothetical protein